MSVVTPGLFAQFLCLGIKVAEEIIECAIHFDVDVHGDVNRVNLVLGLYADTTGQGNGGQQNKAEGVKGFHSCVVEIDDEVLTNIHYGYPDL